MNDSKLNPDACSYCKKTIRTGTIEYHDLGHCLTYPFEEFLKLKNGFPARGFSDAEKQELGLIPKQGNVWQYPLMQAVEVDTLAEVKDALQLGCEYAQECISLHAKTSNPNSRRDAVMGQVMEADLTKIKNALGKLNKK